MTDPLGRYRDEKAVELTEEGWRFDHAYRASRVMRPPDPLNEKVAEEAQSAFQLDPQSGNWVSQLNLDTGEITHAKEEPTIEFWYGASPEDCELFDLSDEIQLDAALDFINPDDAPEMLRQAEWRAW